MISRTYSPPSLENFLFHIAGPLIPSGAADLTTMHGSEWRQTMRIVCKLLCKQDAGWALLDTDGNAFIWGNWRNIMYKTTKLSGANPVSDVKNWKMEEVIEFIKSTKGCILLIARPGSYIPRMSCPKIDIRTYDFVTEEGDFNEFTDALYGLSIVYHYQFDYVDEGDDEEAEPVTPAEVIIDKDGEAEDNLK